MKNTLFSTALLAALLAGGLAQAATTVGSVKSINEAAKTVTLDNGVTYDFTDSMERRATREGYLPGDKVSITWEMSGDRHMALGMSPVHEDGVTGKIKAVDQMHQTVTLENGVVYDFKDFAPEKVDLSGFLPGDEVVIHAVKGGDMEKGVAIASTYSGKVTGVVKSTSQANMTVTLEDGTVYHFFDDSNVKIDGFLPGDKVTLTTYSSGGQHIVQSISPAS